MLLSDYYRQAYRSPVIIANPAAIRLFEEGKSAWLPASNAERRKDFAIDANPTRYNDELAPR